MLSYVYIIYFPLKLYTVPFFNLMQFQIYFSRRHYKIRATNLFIVKINLQTKKYQKRHHEGEESHCFRQRKTKNGIGKKLWL